MRLSEYSRDCLDELRAETGIAYEGRGPGHAPSCSAPRQQLDGAGQGHRRARRVRRALSSCWTVTASPGSSRRWPVSPTCSPARCACPNDQTGDCQLFTTRLAEMAQRKLGVEFRFGAGHRASGLRRRPDQWRAGSTASSETADRYVLALGSYSPQLLKPLGIKAPVYPLKGYSLTVPITNPAMAPTSTILDETYKVAITRFDNRIRVGGMAEIAGFDLSLNPRRRETLEMVVNDLYPHGGDLPAGQLLDRPAPDDPGRHADRRRHPLSQPVPQHRPRHAGLDHGLRLRQIAGRPDGSQDAADQCRRPRYFSLWQFQGDRKTCPSSASTPMSA